MPVGTIMLFNKNISYFFFSNLSYNERRYSYNEHPGKGWSNNQYRCLTEYLKSNVHKLDFDKTFKKIQIMVYLALCTHSLKINILTISRLFQFTPCL